MAQLLMRTDPFREFDRLAQQLFRGNGTLAYPGAMPMDAWREGDTFVVEFDLPGIAPEAIELDVERNVVTVRAERPARSDTQEMLAAVVDTWPAPVDHNPEAVKRTEEITLNGVGLRQLVAAGTLTVGTVLQARDGVGEGHTARVLADGQLELDGVQYETPSGAGKAVLGRAVNGWNFWRLPDGRRLMDVRRDYAGKTQREGNDTTD